MFPSEKVRNQPSHGLYWSAGRWLTSIVAAEFRIPGPISPPSPPRHHRPPVLFPEATRFEFSRVEFTFDVRSWGVETIRKQAVHRARKTILLRDDTGRRTFYVGSQYSPWQLIVYDKAEGIMRIEFVFRRPFLVRNGLLRPIDLLKLRGFDLEQLVTFRRVSPERLKEAAPERSSKWREGVDRWTERWPISELLAYLRDQKISPGKVLRRTQLQSKIAKMQRAFIW